MSIIDSHHTRKALYYSKESLVPPVNVLETYVDGESFMVIVSISRRIVEFSLQVTFFLKKKDPRDL